MVEILGTHVLNGKTRPVETISGMEVGEIKENDRGGEFNCDTL
jgi:hypothetical protein